jgi:phage-related protein
LKQLQEAVGNTLEQIGRGKDFLNRTQKTQQLRERINKWDCIKLKSFCTTKETVTRFKRQPTQWKKIFASYSYDKGQISRIYRKLKNSTPKETPQ